MKKLITSLLISVVITSTTHAFDRSDFVEQLTTDNCSSAPEQLYINTNDESFDFANALSFSWIALQTLDDDPDTIDPDADLTRLEEQWNLTEVKLIDNARWKVRAMIANYEGEVFLTFRHTNSNLNWLLNADFGLWNFNHSFSMGEKVHHGFGTMLGSVWNEIVEELRLRTQNGEKVHIFGHSLGGSLSLLSAPGLRLEGIDVAQVYATGSPKVGSTDWVIAANQVMGGTPIYRLTNGDDLLSRIPVGESSLDEFRHLFSFVPTAITRWLDRVRYRAPYGLFGHHITMTDDSQMIMTDPLTNDIEEQTYWQSIAGQFQLIDESSNNFVQKTQQKIAIITENLGVHLMREDNGYSCKLVHLLKSGM